MSVKISVIIPTYREWERLVFCVDALQKQSFPREDFEVIIVNNDPSDPKPQALVLPEGFTLIEEATPGSYVARNSGINIAKGNILAFLDGDCIPHPDWLKNAVDCFEDDTVDLVGGKIAVHKEEGGSEHIFRYEKYTAFRQDINIPKGKGLGGNLFVRLTTIQICGKFNPDIKSGGDWEFTSRCVKQGHRIVYCENAKVSHPARKTLGEILIKQKRLVAWGIVNMHRDTGVSKAYIVARQLKNGIRQLVSTRYPQANLRDKATILLIENIKLAYRFYIGVLVIFELIDPQRIRK